MPDGWPRERISERRADAVLCREGASVVALGPLTNVAVALRSAPPPASSSWAGCSRRQTCPTCGLSATTTSAVIRPPPSPSSRQTCQPCSSRATSPSAPGCARPTSRNSGRAARGAAPGPAHRRLDPDAPPCRGGRALRGASRVPARSPGDGRARSTRPSCGPTAYRSPSRRRGGGDDQCRPGPWSRDGRRARGRSRGPGRPLAGHRSRRLGLMAGAAARLVHAGQCARICAM